MQKLGTNESEESNKEVRANSGTFDLGRHLYMPVSIMLMPASEPLWAGDAKLSRRLACVHFT